MVYRERVNENGVTIRHNDIHEVEVSPLFVPSSFLRSDFGVFDKRRNGAVKRDGMRKAPPGEIPRKIPYPPQ